MSGGKKESPEKDAKPALEEVVQTGDVKLSKEDEISFRLTEERRRKLEEIGFVWSVRESDAKTDQNRMTRNSYDDLWDAMYERLRAYKEKHGVGTVRGLRFHTVFYVRLTNQKIVLCRIAWFQSGAKRTPNLVPGSIRSASNTRK